MNWKVLFGLFVATIIYIVFGTLMFMYVEGEQTRTELLDNANVNLKNLSRELKERFPGLSGEQYELLIREVLEKYKQGEIQLEDDLPDFQWDFPTTFFFIIITLSTIGYGNIAPVTTLGRALCIVYCLFGIPLMFYTLSGIGEIINAYNRRFRYNLDAAPELTCLVFILRFSLTFIFGWICFIQLPALIFTSLEGWPYPDSIYFAFVTLTTIGFGDLTPNPNLPYSNLTRLAITLWLFLGLAWLSTTIKAMQDIMNHFIYDGKKDNPPPRRLSTSQRRSTVRQHHLGIGRPHSIKQPSTCSRSISDDHSSRRSIVSTDSKHSPHGSNKSVHSASSYKPAQYESNKSVDRQPNSIRSKARSLRKMSPQYFSNISVDSVGHKQLWYPNIKSGFSTRNKSSRHSSRQGSRQGSHQTVDILQELPQRYGSNSSIHSEFLYKVYGNISPESTSSHPDALIVEDGTPVNTSCPNINQHS